MAILTDKFKFIKDDIFLCPWVDTKTGKQKLILKKINKTTGITEFEKKINCIHTAVVKIPAEQFEKTIQDKNFIENILYIRSNEGLMKIDLSAKEKFKALRSWTAGIAEAGLNAFDIQYTIDESCDLAYPMTNLLMEFMILAEPSFIYPYLEKIERECMFEGSKHKSSLIASLCLILSNLVVDQEEDRNLPSDKWKYDENDYVYYLKGYEKFLSAIFEIDPPVGIFTVSQEYYGFLKLQDAVKVSNFKEIFKEDDDILEKIVLNPRITEFEEFKTFLNPKTNQSIELRELAVRHPNAPSLEEFSNTMNEKFEPDHYIRQAAEFNLKIYENMEIIKNLNKITEKDENLDKKPVIPYYHSIFTLLDDYNFYGHFSYSVIQQVKDLAVHKIFDLNPPFELFRFYPEFIKYTAYFPDYLMNFIQFVKTNIGSKGEIFGVLSFVADILFNRSNEFKNQRIFTDFLDIFPLFKLLELEISISYLIEIADWKYLDVIFRQIKKHSEQMDNKKRKEFIIEKISNIIHPDINNFNPYTTSLEDLNLSSKLKNIINAVREMNPPIELFEIYKTYLKIAPIFIKDFNRIYDKFRNLPEKEKQFIIDLEKLSGINIYRAFYLDTLQSFFVQNGHIHSLNFHKDGLDSLPDSIGNLERIEKLDLRGNPGKGLKVLPDTIGNLTHLKELNLSYNNLKSLPRSFKNLINLKKINLNNNNLKSLPSSFKNLKSLNIKNGIVRKIDFSFSNHS